MTEALNDNAGKEHLARSINTPVVLLITLLSALAFSVTAAAQPGTGSAEETGSLATITVRPFGELTLTPIAVPNAIGDGTNPDGALEGIGETIRRSLAISGYFRPLGPDAYFFDASAEGPGIAGIRHELWLQTGAEALIKTSWRRTAAGVALDFRLVDLESQSNIDIEWSPRVVPLAGVRAETVAFVNAVIEYYTGSPGVFGSNIAFTSVGRGGRKHIYSVSMDGTVTSGLTGGEATQLFPSWGPGGVLYYTEIADGQMSVRRAGASAPISSRPGVNMNAAASPDGGSLAVTLSPAGNTDIFIMNADGSGARQCTSHTGEDVSPSWSPDGSRIAFVSDRSGGPQIYVMNADCSGQRRVTFNGDYNTGPEWSPTGNRIAFTGRDGGRYDIFTVDADSSRMERITQDQGSNLDPTWSPDGRYLAFTSTRGGQGARLYISTADGQVQTLVNEALRGVETPAWQR